MDPSLLQQFRQQLASWIEARLESQRLPFQRLELCPRTLTDQGHLGPDLVLWINRDSQLAGSMILLPDVVNAQVLGEGLSLANALGLGHFTTWAAREVSIWNVSSGEANLLDVFDLPPANSITPDDFQQTLDDLLERLKVVTVTSAPPTASYSEHYFANLCLRNLQELAPGLTISARLTAGRTADDEWVEQAPREKAWLSLWRLLFLLQQKRLPPGLQPDRLEFAIHYALSDLVKDQHPWLAIQEAEPPLPDDDAVRLHHLAGRLRQLGWPHNDQHAEEMVGLLINEAAHRFGLNAPQLPWSTDSATLRVNCHRPPSAEPCSLVAPRSYLAGWAFKRSLNEQIETYSYAEDLQSLSTGQNLTNSLAILKGEHSLDRKERESQLMLLRQVWSRRFELPRKTPKWVWDALYLVGLASKEISLALPKEWHHAPGVEVFWAVLLERYQLAEVAMIETGEQGFLFTQCPQTISCVKVHRNNRVFELPFGLTSTVMPGTTQIWLMADESVVELLCSKKIGGVSPDWADETEPLAWGVYLFLQTQLGKYLWHLCSDQSSLPEFDALPLAIRTYGLPLPTREVLADLCLVGLPETEMIPEPDLLEREFANIFGPTPILPESVSHDIAGGEKSRRRRSVIPKEITSKVFEDGIPRFPEHYLMNLYRPEVTEYTLCGVLEITGEFFDKISLRTLTKDHTLEVSGKLIAEALILASYTDQERVSLPNDELILAEIVQRYRSDLVRLHDNLMRACRRFEPHRQQAIKLARRIWQQQNLPPEKAYKTS
ncbi:MAG: hypothetical protein EP304_02295 [Deltaproteobacteria bacterium]|nr:MAG: hypothetical protein EP304_02295 [Deltaproteobacteria bacterium]